MLDFDTMLMHVGEFGLYQKILFIFQAPFCIFVTFISFGQLFILLYPRNYWCEDHFKCLTYNSQIPAAQRRNISYVWRDNGIFAMDSCELNDIDEGFLEKLHQFDENNCKRNRSALCPYCDDINGRCPEQRRRGRQPGRARAEEDYDSSYGRVSRQIYGQQGQRGQQWGNPGRGPNSGSNRYPDTTTDGYDQGGRYPQQGGGGYGTRNPNGGYGTRYPDTTTDGYDDRYSSGTSSQTGGSGFGQGQSQGGQGGRYPSQGGFGSSRNPNSGYRPGSGNGGSQGSNNNKAPYTESRKETPLNHAYGGWPMPKCEGRERIYIVIGANTTIHADKMRNRRSKNPKGKVKKIGECRVRWNRSELPYNTIVTDGDWWCNAEYYTTFAQAIFFVGAIVGGYLIGKVADSYGRVPALVIANVLGAIGGALSVAHTNIWVFSIFRFIAGMAFDNCFTMMYILVLEFCGPTYRTLVANLSIAIFYTIGTILLPILARVIADWRVFTLVTSLPMLLALLALFFVPESARWLLSKGRAKQATTILRNFAKVNRRKVDEQIFVNFEAEATKLAEEWKDVEEPNLTAAFKTPRLRMTFVFLIIFWSMIALVYDGHNRNILNLANEELDLFWLFAIASSTELPADILLIFTLDRFGRRWLAFGSMMLSGLFSVIAGIITPDVRMPFLITAIISRFWVNVAFNIGLQYAAELLPTVIRAQGVNTIHIMGYVASIISPFVAAVGRSNPRLSLFLLGAFAITAGVVSLFLAETLGEELPNTLEEAEAFGKNQSFWNCPICAKETEEEYPISPPPAALEDRPVVLRNALRGSIRGATYRSSMISNASSGGSNRKSRLIGQGYGGVSNNPGPSATELTKLRRITH